MKKKDEFRVIIAGSRSFNDYELLRKIMDKLLAEKSKDHKICIVSGAAKGADLLGERYARSRYFYIERFPANWNRFGKSAGYIRNSDMADYSDALVLFWDGKSRGSMHMKDLATKKGLIVRVINYGKEEKE